jgi:thiol-disulfide isomerase/thioredoxin
MNKSPKSIRSYKHAQSTMGKIMPPIDVRSMGDISGMLKRIMAGPITIVLVYADWCGHCHKFMPEFDAAANSTKASVQTIKVNDSMLQKTNDAINNIQGNNNRPNTNTLDVDGFPTVIAVNNKGEKISVVPQNVSIKSTIENGAKAYAMATNSNNMNVIGNNMNIVPKSMVTQSIGSNKNNANHVMTNVVAAEESAAEESAAEESAAEESAAEESAAEESAAEVSEKSLFGSLQKNASNIKPLNGSPISESSVNPSPVVESYLPEGFPKKGGTRKHRRKHHGGLYKQMTSFYSEKNK